jgi:ubiquinol-cytochrome c reductase subunit 7
MSVPSLTSYVVKRPYLKRWLQPIAEWYTNAAGYRRLGLRYIPSHLAIDASLVSIVDI